MNILQNRLDKTSIKNILTIRYNPMEKPVFRKSLQKDFETKFSDGKGLYTEKLLLKSVENQINDESGPYVISLSSGIDSSLCLGLLRKKYQNEKIIAICGIFDESKDESKQARKIANRFDAKFKTLKMPSIFVTMPKIISITKKPKWNTYTHIIAEEAKKNGNILVTGDGADEIFGGYTFRYSKFLHLLQPYDHWKNKVLDYLECHNRDWVPDQEQMFGRLIKFNWNNIYNFFKPFFQNTLEPLKQVMLADFNGKLLYDFIPSAMAISHHYKIKNTPFFLDPNVIKFGLGLSIKQKFDPRLHKGKIVLRNISKRLGIEHIEEKKGFSPGLWFDWKRHGKKICEKYILSKDAYIFDKGLINSNWVIRAYERVEYDGDIRYLNRLISILSLEIWYRMFISKEMTANKKLY